MLSPQPPSARRLATPPSPRQIAQQQASATQGGTSIALYSAAATAQRGVVIASHARTAISEAIAAIQNADSAQVELGLERARAERLAERGRKARLSFAKATHCRIESNSIGQGGAAANRSPGHRSHQPPPAAPTRPTMEDEAETWGRLWGVPPSHWTGLQSRCFFISHLPQLSMQQQQLSPQLHLPQMSHSDRDEDSVVSASIPPKAGPPVPSPRKTRKSNPGPWISPRARAAEQAKLEAASCAKWPLHEHEDAAALRRQRIREAAELAAQPKERTRTKLSEAREHLSAAQKKAKRRARARAAAEWVAPDAVQFGY